MNRELNARVAVKIFGWTRPLNESGHRMEDVWWRDPEGSYSPSPPAYSSEWAAAVEQPERPGLEWTQLSVSAWNTLSAVAPRKFPFRSLWLILRDAEGWFRARLLDAQVDGDICRDGFRDIAEAQAWCKAEEDRLLAEQEAKSDD